MYFDERDIMMDYTNQDYDITKNEVTYNDVDNKKWDNDFKVDTINIVNYNRATNDMFSSKEGLNKGNMFKNIYDPYKNYIFKIMVNGRKDELLLRIQELTFKMIDLGLYLDLNPSDREMYNDYKLTVEELKKNKELFETNYGPLCKEETLYYDKYKWIMDPWPWMKEGGSN